MQRPQNARVQSYKDLEAWKLAMAIVIKIYQTTLTFPTDEKFGLTAQLRRAAVSIPSNIAEGRGRLGVGDFRRFVSIARGSVAEVETQIAVAIDLGYLATDDVMSLSSELDRLSKMLYGLYRSLGDGSVGDRTRDAGGGS
jgi:four helix bundle protein